MPASSIDAVHTALKTSLSKSGSNGGGSSDGAFDVQLAGAARKALLATIEFEPAGSYQTSVLDKLKTKYIALNCSNTAQPREPEGGDIRQEERLKLADRELYPSKSIQLGWSKQSDWSIGAGMINMGNTCYLNSTLQALFHVPALVNWLISDKEHASKCQDAGLCIICAMRKTLQESQQRNVTSIRPLLIYNKLRTVCRHLIPGRQEDAHEFLRYLVEAMEKSYLCRYKNHNDFDSKVKETTPLNQILGGYLRSSVRCLKCGHVSTTYQHFQDLLLDIRKAQNLDEALEGYFAREKLDDESYHCEACQKKVPATKQFSLERAPMVLCVQLKRFSVSNNKITKHVQFRQRLDLTRYARHRPSVPVIYRLVALVTHMGPTVNCGHYTAVAQVPSGNFYQFDDSMVRMISHQTVFNTNAYIMLYELESSPYAQTNKTNGNCTVGYTSERVYGPELPPDRQSVNGNTTISDSDSDESPKIEKKLSQQTTITSNAPSTITSATKITSQQTSLTKLVPYETDSSSSEESSGHSPKEHDNVNRIVTKASAQSNGVLNGSNWKVSTEIRAAKDAMSTATTINGWKSDTSTINGLYNLSHNGYSAPIDAWNGARAQLDKEVKNERREDRKRTLTDNVDQGRVKHVKLNGNGYNNKSNPGYNPVQEYHNVKNWGHARHKPYYINRHRRNFNQNGYRCKQ